MGKETGLIHLPARDLETFVDDAARFRRPLAKPALELLEGRRRDEDGHRVVGRLLHFAGAGGLELEDAALAAREDALDLRPKRAVPPRDVDDVLEELPALDAREEVLLREEVVVAPLHLAGAASPCRSGNGQREIRAALEERLDQRSLAGPGGARDDEEPGRGAQRRSRLTSSAR